jgi:hypothetical protein
MTENAPVFATKAQKGNEGKAKLILNHATWWPVVTPTTRPLYSRRKAPITQRIGGWVGRTADLDVLDKGERSCPWRNSKLVATLTKLFRFPYAYHSSFVSKTLTISTTHKEETPERIHQTYSNFLYERNENFYGNVTCMNYK